MYINSKLVFRQWDTSQLSFYILGSGSNLFYPHPFQHWLVIFTRNVTKVLSISICTMVQIIVSCLLVNAYSLIRYRSLSFENLVSQVQKDVEAAQLFNCSGLRLPEFHTAYLCIRWIESQLFLCDCSLLIAMFFFKMNHLQDGILNVRVLLLVFSLVSLRPGTVRHKYGNHSCFARMKRTGLHWWNLNLCEMHRAVTSSIIMYLLYFRSAPHFTAYILRCVALNCVLPALHRFISSFFEHGLPDLPHIY